MRTLLTPDEAGGKWCPFARIARRESLQPGGDTDVVIAGVNRDAFGARGKYQFPASCRCFANACMAWRWSDARGDWNDAPPGSANKGYCGLAGPESP